MNSTTRISRRISEEFFSRAGRTVRLLAASIVICFLLPASFPTKARAAEAIAESVAGGFAATVGAEFGPYARG